MRESQTGFSLKAAGEVIYLFSPGRSRVIDAVRYGPQAGNVSSGRWPDGSPGLRALATRTPGATNAAPWIGDVVINEIMYNPVSGDQDDEYVELFNRGTNNVSLAGWRFTSGISFEFPPGATLGRGAYLVVARNAEHLRAGWTNLNSTNLTGNFSGNLANGGERIVLTRPVDDISVKTNGTTTNKIDVVASEVTYGTGGRWGMWAHGGGSSLELIDAHSDPGQASNWADSDETGKSDWTVIEHTGVLDNGSTQFGPDHIEIILLDPGECLVDNVEVIGQGGVNLVPNPTFDGGLSGWTAQGTHVKSRLENSGYNKSPHSLHVIASARGDTGPNLIYAPLTATPDIGSVVTIRARVRWLRGTPEILLRLHGAYLEAAGAAKLPTNLGTPGARNTRAVANAGPAIYDVTHYPVLPAAFQPVTVTARVADPDGVSSVTLKYRVDPSITEVSTNMVDNGLNGDAVAGDGIYTATIPGNNISEGKLVAFHVEAADNARTRGTTSFPAEAPAHECLVLYGETQFPTSLGIYRMWFTQATEDEWIALGSGSNHPLDATFVYGNSRVVYNMQTLYSGSPFHWGGYDGPLGNNCNYLMSFPDDQRFLGQNDFVLNAPANLGSDDTGQREQTFFWMLDQLGQRTDHRRFHWLYVNGQLRGSPTSGFIFEDAQQPNGDMVDE
ncbi:MAG TPA: lamin tail domain-containing protein, partial [Verrucomicrobiae bacterium]|nr:lamin tail domain-containing protein [Verrucomicrobiae bacterium]